MRGWLPVIVMMLLVGCTTPAPPPTTQAAAPDVASVAAPPVHIKQVRRDLDARVVPDDRLRVEAYVVSVPMGAVSGNTAFWQRVDEQVVDPATYDVLFKNGVRVGQASIDEWSYFRNLLAQQPADFQQVQVIGKDAQNVELPLRTELPEQTLFYFDRDNALRGRSYGPSENYLALSFQQSPRHPDSVRLALCPVVRALQQKLKVTPRGESYDVDVVRPEQIFDLNLTAEVPVGDFLIVAPSDQATWPSSIGHQFFLRSGPAERRELVMLLVPQRATTYQQ